MKPERLPALLLSASLVTAISVHIVAATGLAGETALDYRPLPAAYAKRMATDFDALWADMAWLALLQHDGAVVAVPEGERRFGDLEAGLDTITTLDPDYMVAYSFGCWALGDAGLPKPAAALLERGLRHRPGDRVLLFQLGFVRYLLLKDIDGAIHAFEAAGRPDAEPRLQSLARNALRMAAGLAERRHDPDLARQLWLAIESDARQRGDERLAGMARRALDRLRRERASVTAPDLAGR
ncbi:MAG: hypothetical protein VKO64_10555 [Candidatus Sericytochromatia bacterium]|nr:hypothetical protein [Candidatus Sericytochromatia bacterium]